MPETVELIAEGQALVRSLALRIHRSVPVTIDLNDLVAYGEVGLAEAARDFDPARGNQFVTFAYYRIRGAIYDGLAKMTWTSRARYRRMQAERMAVEVLAAEQESDNGKPKDEAESGSWFGRVTERLAMVCLASDHGDDETNVVATAVDRERSAPQRLIHRELSEKLRALVESLPATEKRLIQLVYFDGFNLQEAGVRLGFSKSWASRLHAKILDRLADDMRRLDLHD